MSLSDGAGMLISSVLRLMLDHSYLQSEAGDDEVLLLTLDQEMIQLGEEKVGLPAHYMLLFMDHYKITFLRCFSLK